MVARGHVLPRQVCRIVGAPLWKIVRDQVQGGIDCRQQNREDRGGPQARDVELLFE